MKSEARQQRRKQNIHKSYMRILRTYRKDARNEMQEYKERLVAEKLQDEDFKRSLEATREKMWQARHSWVDSDIDRSEVRARGMVATAVYPEAADAWSEVKRGAVDEFRAEHKLNQGWLYWLCHYLETGLSKPDHLQLYSLSIQNDEFGGSVIRAEICFPLSKGMLDEIAYWMEFKHEKAFGTYYSQIEGGGRPEKTLTKAEKRQLELAEEYHERNEDRSYEGYSPLTREEFLQFKHEDDEDITMDYLQASLELYRRERDRLRKRE